MKVNLNLNDCAFSNLTKRKKHLEIMNRKCIIKKISLVKTGSFNSKKEISN